MLGEHKAIATVAVKDLARAKKFYEETLGLKPTPGQEHGSHTYQAGGFEIFVYQSQFAGTNEATAVTWILGEHVTEVVKSLGEKGVTFEHYDNFPNTRIEGDLHIAGDMKLAWFKDPDGNIHALAGR